MIEWKIILTKNRRLLSTGIFSYCACIWSALGAPRSAPKLDLAATIERAIVRNFKFIFFKFLLSHCSDGPHYMDQKMVWNWWKRPQNQPISHESILMKIFPWKYLNFSLINSVFIAQIEGTNLGTCLGRYGKNNILKISTCLLYVLHMCLWMIYLVWLYKCPDW